MRTGNPSKFWVLGAALFISSIGRLYSQDIYAMPFGGAAGNTYAREPFAFEEVNVSSIRYQQVYSATEFRSLPPQGGFISAISFGSDDQFGRAFITGWPSVQIDMAVTPRGPDQLAASFADNVGGNSVTVYPRGSLGFTSTGRNTSTSRINLMVPYLYNPTDGNLLLENRIFSPSGQPNNPLFRAGPLDAYNNPFGADTVSRVYAYDANATTGTADSIGLTTFFVVTPVPEPSALALVIASLAIFGVWRFRKTIIRL